MRAHAALAVLVAVGALLAAGCDDDVPPRRPADAPGAAPPPAAPDDTGYPAPLLPDEGAGPAEVVIPQGDDAPPAPVPVRGGVGSCDVRAAEPICYAFTGLGWTTAAAQTECGGAPGGVFQTAACPTDGRIGECVYRPGDDTARELVYTFYAPMDPLIAEGVCRGTFRAP